MKALDLYKFIKDNNVEWHRQDNDGTPDVLMFPTINEVGEFNKLLSKSHFDDSGIECRMKDNYFCFWMNDICEYYGIELKEVFDKESWDA